MTKHFGSRFVVYLALTLVSLVFAALLRRIELVMIGTTFAVAIVAALLGDRQPRLRFSHSISRLTLFEGDEVDVEFTVHAGTAVPIAEVVDPLPAGASLVSGRNGVIVSLGPGQTETCRYRLRIDRRSRFTQGRLFHRAYAGSGMIMWEAEWSDPKICTAYPRVDSVSRPVRPFHTQVNVGNYPSREASEGLEFASMREYVPGDRLRTVNWRATQRNGRMYVNEYTRERNADVVLLLDAFEDAGAFGSTVLDQATRIVASLARYFLTGNNRVGCIELSGLLRWVSPNLGTRQQYRILEFLTDVRARESDVDRDITKVPRQILPSQALIAAFTPLIDVRFTDTLLNLASRRFDVAAVVINPALALAPVYGATPGEAVAVPLWRMETDTASRQLAEAGVPIIRLEPDEPVELLAARIDALRRRRLLLQ